MRRFVFKWLLRGTALLIFYGIPYAVPALCCFLGIKGIVEQQWVLLRYRPIPAKVLVSQAIPTPNRASRYIPMVRYSYRVGGHRYFGRSLTIVEAAFGPERLRTILNQYHPGRTSMAYYDPGNPAQSVLSRNITFNPYGYLLLGLMMLMMVKGTIVLVRNDRKYRIPPELTSSINSNAVERHPSVTLSGHWQAWRFAAATATVGVLAIVHFYWRSQPPYSSDAVVVSALFVLIWMAVTPMALRWWWLGHVFRDARLILDPPRLVAGTPQICRIKQNCLHQTVIDYATLSLKCRQNKGRNKMDKWIMIQFQELAGPFRAAGGEELAWDVTLDVPPDLGLGLLSDSVEPICSSYVLQLSLKLGIMGTLKQNFRVQLLTEPDTNALPRCTS